MFSTSVQNGIKTLGRLFSNSVIKPKTTLDSLQEASLKENCFLIDENDKVVGQASKKECHLVKSDGSLLLHRAFSVFMFNGRGDLLLQKRSPMKVKAVIQF